MQILFAFYTFTSIIQTLSPSLFFSQYFYNIFIIFLSFFLISFFSEMNSRFSEVICLKTSIFEKHLSQCNKKKTRTKVVYKSKKGRKRLIQRVRGVERMREIHTICRGKQQRTIPQRKGYVYAEIGRTFLKSRNFGKTEMFWEIQKNLHS